MTINGCSIDKVETGHVDIVLIEVLMSYNPFNYSLQHCSTYIHMVILRDPIWK